MCRFIEVSVVGRDISHHLILVLCGIFILVGPLHIVVQFEFFPDRDGWEGEL